MLPPFFFFRGQKMSKRPPGLQGMIQLPLLEILEERGGKAKPGEIYDEIADRLNLDRSIRKDRKTAGEQDYAVFDQQVRWARQTLVAKDMITGERGSWEITDKGRSKLQTIRRGKMVLIYSVDNGLAFLAHAEDAASVIEPESLSLILTSPPYPVVKREYGRFGVPEWLDWMSNLVGMWKELLREDGTLAINLMDVFTPGSPMLSPYVERFVIDAIDRHGLHLAGRMPWHSPNKLANLEWSVKRKQALRNTVEHVILLSKNGMPAWNTDRLPREPYTERSEAQLRSDAKRIASRQKERRPGGYDINNDAFSRSGEGRNPSNLIISGGVGGGGVYARRCREAGLISHPARFPEELPRRVILLTTEKGEVVYDPMAGSNTTGKVAMELERRFISSEPVVDYATGSAFRFDQMTDYQSHMQ